MSKKSRRNAKKRRKARREDRRDKRNVRQNKRKERRKEVVAKVKKKVSKVGFAALSPLKGVMTTILDKKGVEYNKGDIQDIAVKFYENILGKKVQKLEQFSYDSEGNQYETFALSAATIGAIVAGIIGFFREAKNRKEEMEAKGEPVPDLINAAGNAYSDVEEGVRDEAVMQIKQQSFTPLLIGGAVLLVIALSKK
jgi:hypothetical protein